MVRKIFKRFYSVILAFSIILSNQSVVLASEKSSPISLSTEFEFNEALNVEGVEYVYKGYLNNSRQRTVEIRNTENDILNVVVCDSENGLIYLDNEVIGHCYVDSDLVHNNFRAGSSWNYLDSGSNYISWEAGTSVAVVAGIISNILAAPVGTIIGAVGTFAGICTGGTISWTKWYRMSGNKPEMKTEWTFRDDAGHTYGPYTYIIGR